MHHTCAFVSCYTNLYSFGKRLPIPGPSWIKTQMCGFHVICILRDLRVCLGFITESVSKNYHDKCKKNMDKKQLRMYS